VSVEHRPSHSRKPWIPNYYTSSYAYKTRSSWSNVCCSLHHTSWKASPLCGRRSCVCSS